MVDCFISYKREDRERVERIAASLREAGFSVWWDVDLAGGSHWRETIVSELDGARCVLVCWSTVSIGAAGTYVREEAERAKHRGVLLPLLLDRVAPPFGFGEVQALDLSEWKGSQQSPSWQAVLRATEAVLLAKPQPPAQLRRRRLAWVGGVGAVVLTVVGLLADLTGLQPALCKLNLMAWLCSQAGLGPSDRELRAWTLAKTDASGERLTAYLAAHSNGAFAAEALARKAACREVFDVRWAPYVARANIVLPSGPIQPLPSEESAKEALRPGLQRDAEDACSAFALSELYRPAPDAKPSLSAEGWDCRSSGRGWRCRYDGKVSCPQEKRQTFKREVCPTG